MVYKLPNGAGLEFVALKICNINQMVDFYTKVIGLYLVERTENQAYLGIPSQKKIFISLKRVKNPSKERNVANMKSFSLLLPDRESLKKIIVHINNLGIKIPKIEVNDNFDLFYLKDPEGNQISLGVMKSNHDNQDKKFQWFKSTRQVSLNQYLKKFKSKSDKLPDQTRLGWVEMTVSSLQNSLKFYHHLGVKAYFNANHDCAALISENNNHPQFILQQTSSALNPRNVDTVGLDYMNINVSDSSEISKLAQNLKKNGIECQYSKINHFIFLTDPDKINITFSLL